MNHLFLTGFMGAGKSTVGRLVAEGLGRPFLDLDRVIEQREGMTVSEIFAARGEAGFRDAEHAALEQLTGEEPAVVATGGGVVLREDNQVLLRRQGSVVFLSVTPEEALARLGDAGDRPLLIGEGLAAARGILEARLALYRATADHVVETVGRTADEVAEAVVTAVSGPADILTLHVGTPGAPDGYDLVLGEGTIDTVGARVRAIAAGDSVALVSDETVWALFGERVAESLRQAGFACSVHKVPAGESSKSWDRAGVLLEEFAVAALDRGSTVVSLGGGVAGDLAGFCAAVYMRGIALVHVPTTLLAQVDSAIGGKTGVDLAAGKNLVGAFWPPRLVVADPAVLATLPPAEWTNGCVEMAKAALLEGGEALASFEHDLRAIVDRDSLAVSSAVRAAASFKTGVVTADLRESDVRECLNLGHTLGHALELLTGYTALPHGLAVAEGMRFASTLAEELLGASPETTALTRSILEAIGAGERVCRDILRPHTDSLGPAAVLAAMKADKKSRSGVVRLVLLEAPGRWLAVGVDDAVLVAHLERWASRLGEGSD